MDMVTCEVWILVSEDGSYEISTTNEDLQAETGVATRLVKLAVKVPVPKVVELVATVAAEPDAAELTAV